MNNEKFNSHLDCGLCGGTLSNTTKVTLIAGKLSEVYECLNCGEVYPKLNDKEIVVNQPDWGVVYIDFSSIHPEVACSLLKTLKDIWIRLDDGVTQQVLASGQKFELDQNNKLELFAPIGSFFELEDEVRKRLNLIEVDNVIFYKKVNKWGAIHVGTDGVKVDGVSIISY